jgi:hypothetical protein
VLTEAQKRYAATDAWACIQIYEEILRLDANGYMLEIIPEPEKPEFPVLNEEEIEKKKKQKEQKKKEARKRRAIRAKANRRKKKERIDKEKLQNIA